MGRKNQWSKKGKERKGGGKEKDPSLLSGAPAVGDEEPYKKEESLERGESFSL